MVARQIDAVLTLVDRDWERAEKLLLPTLQHFFAPLGTLWVVVPASDADAALARFDGPRFRVISELEVVPELQLQPEDVRSGKGGGTGPRTVRGWYVQQLIKLSIARLVSTPFYLTLDADVVCVKPINYDDLIQDARAVANVSDADYHPTWYEWAQRVLGFPRSGKTHGVTPVVLSREAVHRLFSFLAARLSEPGARPESYLLANLPWTEYALYYSYLEHKGLFSDYHFAARHNTYGNSIWNAEDLRNWDPARSFSARYGFYFSVLQSHTVNEVDEIVERIRDYFRGIESLSPV